MRVVAGRYRGRRFAAVRGREVRPTSARVREALFQVIGPMDGLTIADLYAGSGSLGIEALSRGASRAVFVERDHAAVGSIRQSIESIVPSAERSSAVVVHQDVVSWAANCSEQFDVVLVDPPWSRLDEELIANASLITSLLKPTGLVTLELPRRTADDLLARFVHSSGDAGVPLTSADHRGRPYRRWGDTVVALLERGGQQ